MAHMRNPDVDVQQHLEALYTEKEHMTKEIFLLRETIKEMEVRMEAQKQTLAAREESIKKLMEMLQNKGIGNKLMEEERKEVERLKTKLIETEARACHLENLLEVRDKDVGKLKEMDELRIELNKRDQEILAMGAKMKTLEEQHQDYQRHIAVLKESLCAKEEHYNMLQADVRNIMLKN
ncbi:ELKS/Rab6-interacting/CAST family member 1-like [Centruroides sculpturatus]|uniref:ELKS/Rab6-interacting/CAST family member 1-like n=1 Tax=Centruroides sculpturatus TaxID=218467 RepID=UPI000C6EAF6D|nr:ELKS/Rab6-interacting/CAST family member 1-like [Centruroides sculpturatus]